MKRLAKTKWALFAIIIAVLVPMSAVADENTCTFKVDAKKVHIVVWGEDSEEDRQDKIFEGWLESGDRKKVQSATGFIVYSYKEAGDDRSYGDNHKRCKGGNTIRVP